MFSHLRAHTEYSIKDGTLKLSDYVGRAAKDGMPSCAITDLDNMFGVVSFYEEARKNGVKPIVGCDLTIEGFGENPPSRVLVLCKNNQGYKKLMSLISRGYIENQINGQSLVKREWLNDIVGDVICLSGTEISSSIIKNLVLNQAEADVSAKNELTQLKGIFGEDFYIELQRTGSDVEDIVLNKLVNLSDDLGIPVCATHPIQFLDKEDFLAHEVKVCVYEQEKLQDRARPRIFNPYQYMLTSDEMTELFKDIPEAIQNTNYIASQCNVKIELGKNYLPDFRPDDGSNLNDFFAKSARDGLKERMIKLFPDESERNAKYAEYSSRLETEIKTIIEMGFPGYFMVVSDFIRWAKSNEIPVGPGRGSGAGSLVAYSLNITELDPIKYNLLFERFLNPERVSMPDFDIDFCSTNRGRVIEYVKDKYGADAVCQISTFGTTKAKAAIKDVGRVLDHNFNFLDQITKMIPNELEITLAEALEKEPKLKEKCETDVSFNKIYTLAQKIEGVPRSVGMHAGGVLIAPTKITDFSPTYLAENSDSIISQYDKDSVEKAGLVKFDFLALSMLTLMDKTVKLIRERVPEAKDFSLANLDVLDDPEVFKLINAGNLISIFQMEGAGLADKAVAMGIDNFEDIIAILALYRPGPLNSGMVDDYIKRKRGEKPVEYMHPMLEEILKPTYGVIVYQEQVMQIAQKLSGYTLGGADLLRRAMGKKKPEEMEKQKSIFIDGAKKNGVAPEKAKEIFELIEYFAEYGFNKSHSAVYGLITYQTAYLKSHYPAYFIAAALSEKMSDTDKIKVLFDDAKRNNIQVLSPDVNKSGSEFVPSEDGTAIIYALSGLKGVGEQVAVQIEEVRQKQGNFVSLLDFIEKVGRKQANKKTCESLIKAGAFDSIDPNRAKLLENLPKLLEYVGKVTKSVDEQESTLFEFVPPDPALETKKKKVKAALVPPVEVYVEDWNLLDKLEHEKSSIGFYLSGDPMDYYKAEMPQLADYPKLDTLDDHKSEYNNSFICGIVNSVKEINAKNGKMAFVNLTNDGSAIDVTVFSRLYEEARDLLKPGNFIMVSAKITDDKRREGSLSVIANDAYSFTDVQDKLAESVVLTIPESRVKYFFENYRPDFKKGGTCQFELGVITDSESIGLPFKKDFPVNYNTDLISRLRDDFGQDSVKVTYKLQAELQQDRKPYRKYK